MTKVVITVAQNEEDMNDTIELAIRSKHLLTALAMCEPEEDDSPGLLASRGWGVGQFYQAVNSLITQELDSWFNAHTEELMSRVQQPNTDEENSSEKEGVKGEE